MLPRFPALLCCLILLVGAPRSQAALPAPDMNEGGPRGVPGGTPRTPSEVKERVLASGVRVLLVERPGTGAFHASLFVRGGRAETVGLPPVAADLLARTLFGRALPQDLEGPSMDVLLRQEEGACEALRLRRLQAARMGPGPDDSALQDLTALHQKALGEIQRLDAACGEDAFDALGATGRQVETGADHIRGALELPREAFGAWCRLQAQRLARLQLGRLPLVREQLVRELSQAPVDPLDIFLNTALPGRPYAQVAHRDPAALESLGWIRMRAYARWATAPGRLCLVLVGDLEAGRAWPLLEGTLGALDAPAPEQDRPLQPPVGETGAEGARRLEATLAVDPCCLMAWRIPPASDPDAPGLELLARVLGQGRASRLQRRLAEAPGPARGLEVLTGIPGGSDQNLLLVQGRPAEGRSLGEMEAAVQSEILKLQQEPLQELELRRAQGMAELAELCRMEDAAGLARALGEAQSALGDWHLAFRKDASHTPEELQALARRYLVPSRSVSAFLEPDLLHAPQDALERKLGEALGRLAARKQEDPARREALVRGALRQMRLLSRDERAALLGLLEAEVKP